MGDLNVLLRMGEVPYDDEACDYGQKKNEIINDFFKTDCEENITVNTK